MHEKYSIVNHALLLFVQWIQSCPIIKYIMYISAMEALEKCHQHLFLVQWIYHCSCKLLCAICNWFQSYPWHLHQLLSLMSQLEGSSPFPTSSSSHCTPPWLLYLSANYCTPLTPPSTQLLIYHGSLVSTCDSRQEINTYEAFWIQIFKKTE